MTCAHVLGLIDVGPFADYPAEHLDAAWTHARGCATCGPALTAAAALATDLASLPQPDPPAHLAASVMARIARLEPPHTAAAPASVQSDAPVLLRWQDRAAALAGVAAGGVVVLSIAVSPGTAVDLTSPRIGGLTGLLTANATSTGGTAVAVGLVLYLVGLFAPLRSADAALEKRVLPDS